MTHHEQSFAGRLRSVSPAAKELAATKASDLLKGSHFLKTVRAVMERYLRMQSEVATLQKNGANIRLQITNLRNARKTLVTLQENVKGLHRRLNPSGWDIPNEFEDALKNLEACEDRLREREEFLVWCLHPRTRKPHYKLSTWAMPSLAYEYPLQKLTEKAPDQWVVERLNSKLEKLLMGKAHISDITRYRIVSTLLQIGVGVRIEPTTIKQQFVTRRSSIRSSKKSAQT